MKILIAIPGCARLDYGKWESTDSPLFDKGNAYLNKGYGKDIHFSGDNDRIKTVRETWGQDVVKFPGVDLKFFYGIGSAALLPDEVLLPVQNDYEHLPHKVIEICRYAVEREYDYLFKCDDDTYVWVDRLMAEIAHKRWDYAGYCAHLGSVSGGPGYWLSNRAMKLVAATTPNTWAEDKVVEAVMSRNRIRAVSLPAHRCGGANHWCDINDIPADTVTMHAVKPEDMRTLYGREHA